jgi:hypothetical protein
VIVATVGVRKETAGIETTVGTEIVATVGAEKKKQVSRPL